MFDPFLETSRQSWWSDRAKARRGLGKHENAGTNRIEDRNGFMSMKSSEYLYETPLSFSHLLSSRAKGEVRKLIEEILGGRA